MTTSLLPAALPNTLLNGNHSSCSRVFQPTAPVPAMAFPRQMPDLLSSYPATAALVGPAREHGGVTEPGATGSTPRAHRVAPTGGGLTGTPDGSPDRDFTRENRARDFVAERSEGEEAAVTENGEEGLGSR